MNDPSRKRKYLRKSLVLLVLMLVVVAVSGCRTLSFYAQAMKGQYQLFATAEPVKKLLADPKTPPPLKDKLLLLGELRAFADQELKLPINAHYQKYVDLHRPYVVWNVQAAREFSMEPKSWWYPLVGSLEYRGYFSREGAHTYGDYLNKKGYDVYIGGASAYSTLGWFKDPVLNTFIFEPESIFAETIFHELGHQRVFARGDMDFNEAFATTVGQEGARRWLRSKHDSVRSERYEDSLRRTRQFVHLVMKAHARLEALYGDERNEEGKVKSTEKKRDIPRDQLREEKAKAFADLRREYAELKTQWGGSTDYEKWFSNALNNAKLNSVAAYYDLVPGFEQVLALNGGNLEKFYQEVERLSKMPKKERHQWLRTIGQELPKSTKRDSNVGTQPSAP